MITLPNIAMCCKENGHYKSFFELPPCFVYLEYCPCKAAAHAIPEDVYLWWIWLWLWWWQYRWGFSLVKMLLIMLMIYVWQRCRVSGCLVGCFSKSHIFLHSPLFDNRATAKWPIRYFCATSSTLLRANNCINFEIVPSFSFLSSEGEVLCLGQLTTA